MGFTRTQTFGFIVLPQMIQRILPVYKGEFISLVKMTSIVGYIAVQDLTKASDIIRSRTFDPFFPLIMVAVLYFIIAWVLMQALEHLERITDPKYRRRQAWRDDRVEQSPRARQVDGAQRLQTPRSAQAKWSRLSARPAPARARSCAVSTSSTIRRAVPSRIDGVDVLARKATSRRCARR